MPLAAMAAMAAYAVREPAAAASEGMYLAVLAGAAFLCVGFLAPRPAFELGFGAVLAAAAGWALPSGPGRGAAVTLLLAAVLAIAAVRRLADCLPDLPLDVAVPLALGTQVLLRGGLLFQPQANLRTLVAVLALPTAGAVAAWMLARRQGGGAALLAAGTVLVLAPGWNVAATLGLIALAAGDQLARPSLGRIGRGLALAVLIAPIAWEPGPGLAAAVAGLALWRPRLALGCALPVAAALLWAGSHGHGPAPAPLDGVALLILLVPAAALPDRDRSWLVPAALLLAAAAPRIPDASALAAPLALAALAVRRDGPAAVPQRVWTGALLGGTALLAAYPWLRADALLAAVERIGLAPGGALDWRGAAAVLAVFLGLAAVTGSRRRLSGTAAAGSIVLAVFLHLPRWGSPLLPPETGVILDPAHPAWVAGFAAPRQVGGVVVESSLSSGAGLEDGTPVATVRLRDATGKSLLWVLRAGEGTGEWAARRPDVERTARLRSPPAWISWIAGDFFGQRYRAAWSLEVPARCTQVRVERARGLPPDVGLTLHQLEVRRGSPWALPAGDPFRGTLMILPLILAGLWQIRRWCERLGGGTLGSGGTAGELAALAILLLLVLARPHLALARADEALAAGLLLVLGHRLARQTTALRPLLGERVPARPSVLFFALPLIAYLAILPWSTDHRQPDGDEPFNLLITHSLAYDFDADLTDNYAAGDWKHFMARPIEPQPGDPRGPHGEVYSRHNELLPLLLAPAYRLAGKNGALAMMAALTAALAWMTVRLARHYDPDRPGEVLAAWALAAFAPPLLLYSYQVWVEVPAALLLMGGLDRILTLDGRSWRWKEWLGIGLSVLLLPLLKIRFLLVAGPLLALGWWHAGRRRPVLILGAMLAALAGGMLLYNQILYSNPLKIHTWQEVDPAHYGPLNYYAGLTGLLWDAAFGLFGCAPVWLLLLPAALLQLVRRQRLPAHLAVLTLPYLVVVAPRIEWYGGWSPPFRYALIGLPLLGLLLVPLLAQRNRPGARALLSGLAALTLALALVWVVVPGWTYNFADGRTYLLDSLGERLGLDVARFFPSSIRLRSATWLWPPLSLVVVCLLWWWPSLRPAFPPSPGDREGGAGRRAGGEGLLAGIASVLLLAAALPVVAARTPTRTVELEDPQVWKSGGHLYPDRWVIERARYRGSWVLRVGDTLRAPVHPGGRRTRLAIQAQLIRNQPVPFSLDVLAGDRLLATWRPGRERTWETIALGPFDWPAGAPLILAAHGARPPGELNGVLLDRVDLSWP